MPSSLSDRFETTDGSRPMPSLVRPELGGAEPLVAFAILADGDAFERLAGPARREAIPAAKAYVNAHVTIDVHGSTGAYLDRIRGDLVCQLGGNPHLTARLAAQKPLHVDVVPEGASFRALGFPAAMSHDAAGVFWNVRHWPYARVGLRAAQLESDPTLVFHEMAHAVHYLAFTKRERELIYRLLRPTFGSASAMDEAFAIYSERELAGHFTAQSKKARGVYGWTRQHWSEDHLLTRFVRKLYFPHKPLAGPTMHSPTPPRGPLPRLPR